MRAGDKAADLGSRREGTVLILESRPTAVVSWRRLRASQSAFVKRSRAGEKVPPPAAGAPAPGGNAGRMNSWRFPRFGIFRSYFEVSPPSCNITALYYKNVLLYEQRTL
jgi:hypothetical protein